ncbi:MAG: hypothetical protein M3Z24_06295 [Chloroflexota bacterium]|nr:hypothetical protein [Chloroflexota bacterium]
MQSIKTAVKEASWVFVLSRIILSCITYSSVVLIPQNGQRRPVNCPDLIHSPCMLAWYHWDDGAYVRIAHQGYSFTPDVGFFPLWPLLVHYGGLLLGGSFPLSYYLAGMILSNLFFFVALVLLYLLLSEDFEPSLAKRALFYLSFYPYALFFFVGYTESLFIMLCIAVFLLIRRGKVLDWWFAGLLGFLAALTRSSGILLTLPFFVMYLQHFWAPTERPQHNWLQRTNALAPILLFPLGVVVYMIYLGSIKGDPLVFRTVEATYWARHFDWIWHTYYIALHTIATYPFFSVFTLRNILDITFTILPIAALIVGWKRLPLHYNLFTLAVVLFSLSFPINTPDPLASQSRYMMAVFPIIVVFALWGKHPRFEQIFLAIALPLLAVLSILFISHYWVA